MSAWALGLVRRQGLEPRTRRFVGDLGHRFAMVAETLRSLEVRQ